MMKGLRTVAVGLGMAVGAPALTYLAGVNWDAVLPAPWSWVVAGGVMIGMRLVTTGPVGRS